MNQEYTTKITASIALLFGSMTTGLYLMNSLIIGVGLLSSFITFRTAEKTSNIYGKTKNTKILNSLTPNLIEFSTLTATIFFVPEPVVSTATLGITGLSAAAIPNLKKTVRKNIYSIFERTERVIFLSGLFIAGFFNSYLLIYGLIVLSVLVSANLAYIVYRSVSW